MAEITTPDKSFSLTVYTMKETAATLNVSLRTVQRYVAEGKIKSAMIGGKRMITRENLIAFCNGE